MRRISGHEGLTLIEVLIAAAILANVRRVTITVGVQSPPGAWRPQAFTMISDIRARNL